MNSNKGTYEGAIFYHVSHFDRLCRKGIKYDKRTEYYGIHIEINSTYYCVYEFYDSNDMISPYEMVDCMKDALNKIPSKYRTYRIGCNGQLDCVIVKGFEYQKLIQIVEFLVCNQIKYFEELIDTTTNNKPDNKINNKLVNICNGIIKRLETCKNNEFFASFVTCRSPFVKYYVNMCLSE